jgi:hypothetical protein
MRAHPEVCERMVRVKLDPSQFRRFVEQVMMSPIVWSWWVPASLDSVPTAMGP